jgi:N-acetyl-alpha-D-glucosaminyl L-malate synthase BshA
VSQSLKDSTIASLGINHEVDVIPNFLDCAEYQQRFDAKLRAQLAPAGTDALVVHMSNFRPVKRVDAVIDVFRLIRRQLSARLILIGDGPDRAAAERQVEGYGLDDHVVFVGEERDPLRWLSVADLFLLPSGQESFGLAALEAMACEVPVISSNVGGLPEIVRNGVTGYATLPDALDEMAARAVQLIRDPERRRAMGRAGAEMVRADYCADRIVPLYEAAYERALTS